MRLLLARSVRTALDVLALTAAFWIAFLLRFEGDVPLQMLKRAVFLWPYVVGGQYMLLRAFGVTQFSWRHVGLWEAKRILAACATSTALLLIARYGSAQFKWGYFQYVQVPAGVILMDFVLMFLGVTGVRVVRRVAAEEQSARSNRSLDAQGVPTLLVGAGQAGVMVAKEILGRRNLGIKPVGFIDDDRLKTGVLVHGLRVLGTSEQLVEIARSTGAKQILITIANADGKSIRRISEACRKAELPTKIIPGIYEIVGGQVNLSRIRDVSIQDLLGREPVVLEQDVIEHVVSDRVVLVSGAAGSIGKELCLQAARFRPRRLVAVDQAETGLFYAVRELRAAFPDLEVVPCIGDICDEARMRGLFEQHRPQAVFHAAAYKHVGMMEDNVREALRNNVLGTRVLADFAHEFGATQFVMISTDKAVNPSSVMGASKRLAEMYVQALSQESKTLFVAVRFGNVLGSAGSVIPIFTEQIARGGPVTVTDPEMRRYFMTIAEASQLVLQAAGLGRGGEIFILDMGEPVKIVDLARDLISLSGLRVGEDIDIVFTGVQAGEKLFEELSVAEEKADRTRHPKIFVGKIQPQPLENLRGELEQLAVLVGGASGPVLRSQLERLVPEYAPDSPITAGSPAASEIAPRPVTGVTTARALG